METIDYTNNFYWLIVYYFDDVSREKFRGFFSEITTPEICTTYAEAAWFTSESEARAYLVKTKFGRPCAIIQFWMPDRIRKKHQEKRQTLKS